MDELPSREDVADTLGRKSYNNKLPYNNNVDVPGISNFNFVFVVPMGSFELNVHSYLDGVLNIAEDLVRFGTVGVGFGINTFLQNYSFPWYS